MKEYIKKQETTITKDAGQDLLTVQEVASILRVDNTTVRRWIKKGALKAVILPHLYTREAYRIKQETIDDLLRPA